jgi:uncharacterized protein YdhG (YjbR/CyaY superfamily)
VPRDEIHKVMGPGIDEVFSVLAAQGIAPVGPWFSHHLRRLAHRTQPALGGLKEPMKTSFTTIDEYLATVSDDKRAALEKLRQTIRAVVPEAEECISYGVPTFRLGGKNLVHFGAAKNHCSFYPGTTIAAFADELKGYETSKGTIRFQPQKPLPAALVRKIVKARIAERISKCRGVSNKNPASQNASRVLNGKSSQHVGTCCRFLKCASDVQRIS